ncbi:hypothetical protein BDN71DRAFT_1525511 [Pleurotus eryngii]|uniref:Uncharacterized protein n=1 Tax=Pleurotus eryngii TaxID=5323 RepID=A0A9P6D3R3_PLEER|nr:hypothetical protein BDN71DRAFT_1525511 [Pleurotus eryngii]
MASSLQNTIQNSEALALAAFTLEEATAGNITIMPLMLVRDGSPMPPLPSLAFRPSSSVPSLLGEIITGLFEHFNEFIISLATSLLTLGNPGVLFLDGTAEPNFMLVLGEDCWLKCTTLAFIMEIHIYHPASEVIPIIVNTITEPFVGELLFTPTYGELSMESIIFDPRYYGFGVVIGFFAQSSDGHFLKLILHFNAWRDLGGIQERSKLFVVGWVHWDHMDLCPEDHHCLEENSRILDKPSIQVEPLSTRYIVYIFP